MLDSVSHQQVNVPWLLRGKLLFASYRRQDSADVTGRICDGLVRKFGRRRVIQDIDSIPLGTDFKDYIERTIPHCRVMLAVIGPNWQIDPAADGRRYFDDPKDLVGFEIASALRHKVRIIPVLVGGASMPTAEQLPDALRPIVGIHGMQVRSGTDFHNDMQRLLRGLQGR